VGSRLPRSADLVTVKRDGKLIDAVSQITKSGHVWLFDRETGKPLFPVEYRKVSTDAVDGEAPADTQPLPLKPPAFSRQIFTEDMITTRTEAAHKAVLERFKKVRSKGQFEPPSLEGTVVFPGFDGGGEWGGAAFDPDSGLLYVNANEMAWILRLVERAPRPIGRAAGICIGSTVPVASRRPARHAAGISVAGQDRRQVHDGGNRRADPQRQRENARPPHAVGSGTARHRNLRHNGEDKAVKPAPAKRLLLQPKYQADGYNKFLDPDGLPRHGAAVGTLNAIDLNKVRSPGRFRWENIRSWLRRVCGTPARRITAAR